LLNGHINITWGLDRLPIVLLIRLTIIIRFIVFFLIFLLIIVVAVAEAQGFVG
jgi:hypothetical protein